MMSAKKENIWPKFDAEGSKRERKSVKIREISSDQIVQHIVTGKCVEEKKAKKKYLQNGAGHVEYTPTFSSNKKSNHKSSSESEDEEADALAPQQDGGRLDGQEVEDEMAGRSMFKFRTPKKSGQMALKALDSFSPGTGYQSPDKSKSSAASSPLVLGASQRGNVSPLVAKTPPRSQRLASRKSLEPGYLTPNKSHGVAGVRQHNRMESSTPYRLRKRQVIEPQDSSSDDSVDESSENDDDDDEATKIGDLSLNSPMRSSNNNNMNMAANAETYFDLHAAAPVTSDRTLAALEGPRLDVETVRTALAKVAPHHARECKALMDKHARLFDRWMLHMCQGFNILLHGLGSKRPLLEQFREGHLSKFSHLVVNGYFPSLTVKHILNSITEDILGSSKGFTNAQAQVEFIKQEYKNRDEDFYLVINNIDGVLLRSEKCQTALSMLAEIEGFHIIASLDHINACFMWDQSKYFRFRWLWYETPTFAHYEAENCYENSLMVQQSGGLALSSLAHVMRSLTPNARQIFLVLAQYQMELGDSANYAGMSFQVLYHKCREAFLVNSDLTLQAQLVEFKDHRLLKVKKNFEGIEHLSIPIDQVTLKEFLQDHQNSI